MQSNVARRANGRALVALLALSPLFWTITACADTIRIVALGASNASGYAVGPGQAWPVQLEGMLRAKGYNVSVTVNAVNGATSVAVLRLASSIPAGTQIVVYDLGRGNDIDQGIDDQTRGIKLQVDQRVREQGAIPIFVAYSRIVGSESENKSAWRPNDPHHHLTAESHAKVAAALLPQVIAAIGNRR